MHRTRNNKTFVLLLIAAMIVALVPGFYAGKAYAAPPTSHTLVGEGVAEYGDLKVDVVDGNIMVSRYSYVNGNFKFVPQYASNGDDFSKSAVVLKFGSEPAISTDTFVLGAGTSASEWGWNYLYTAYSITQTISDNNHTVTTTWRLRPSDESHIEVVQRVTLPSKSAQYIDVEWEITNVDELNSTLQKPRFLRGVTAISDHEDSGGGFWDETSKSVGTSTGMQTVGIQDVSTTSSWYTVNRESDVKQQMSKGALDNKIDDFRDSNNAYAIQWDASKTLGPGDSWTVKAREGFVDNRPEADSDGSDSTSGEPVPYSYTLKNYGLTSFTVDYEVVIRDESQRDEEVWPEAEGWTITPNEGSVTLAAREGLVLGTLPINVTVTPPADVAVGHYLLTFYFTYRSLDTIGVQWEMSSSNRITVTDASLNLSAPTNVAAQPGDQTVSVTWNAVDSATDYWVYQSTNPDENGERVAIVTDTRYSATGLVNGTTYYFRIKSVNDNIERESGYSAQVSAKPDVVYYPPVTIIDDSGVDVLVNGKVERAGKMTKSLRNSQTVSTIAIDPEKLAAKLAAEGQHTVVTIPVNTQSDIVVGELNGEMVKSMEGKQAVLEIRTDKATYTLPAEQLNIDAISAQIGKSIALQDIKVQIEIATSTADTVKIVENAAGKGSFTIVLPPMDFKVTAVYGDKTVEVDVFNVYVERMIAIPEGTDPNRITTGIVVDPDGTSRHVPTKIVMIDGKYYAAINSLTNSTYAVVWHPLDFQDMTNHWAKDAVNNMGSRMVVQGVGGNLFDPDKEMTRAEFAEIIVRGLGLKPSQDNVPFSDVSTGAWYSSAVATAYSYQLISGFEDGTFRPNDKITREQAMMITARAMKITGLADKLPAQSADEVLQQFKDRADASNWALSSIVSNVQAGVVSGRSSTVLAPGAYMTRAEVAVIVQNLLQKSDLI